MTDADRIGANLARFRAGTLTADEELAVMQELRRRGIWQCFGDAVEQRCVELGLVEPLAEAAKA